MGGKMNTTPVLNAVKTILSASFDRVYIYPTEYASMPASPDLPFVVIEEMTGVENGADFQGGLCTWDRWNISINVHSYEGVHVFPSAKDALAQAASIADRDTVEALIKANSRLNGTTIATGDSTSLMRHGIAPLQWNERPYMGSAFTIPVFTD